MEEKVFITTMSDTIYGVSIGIKRTQKVHNNGLIRHQLCRSTMDIIYQRTPNSIYIPTGAILTSSMVYEVAVLRTEKQWHSNCPVNFDSNRALNTGMPLINHRKCLSEVSLLSMRLCWGIWKNYRERLACKKQENSQ